MLLFLCGRRGYATATDVAAAADVTRQLLTNVSNLNARYQPSPATCVRLLIVLAAAKLRLSFQDDAMAREFLRVAVTSPGGLRMATTRQLLHAVSQLKLAQEVEVGRLLKWVLQ